MKKVISFVVAFALIIVSVVPVFADSFITQKNKLNSLVDYMERAYIYRFYQLPPQVPNYSDASTQRMQSAISQIRADIDSYSTNEEYEAATQLLYDCKSQMYVSSSELEFMLDMMKNDYDNAEYYDNETSAEITSIYESALNAYENGTEKDIHIAYFNMRNELNKLCLGVSVAGDVNNDGKFNIIDITLVQKYLVGIEKLTSAQLFAAGVNKQNNSISWATDLQKSLVQIQTDGVDAVEYVDGNIKQLTDSYYIYPFDLEYFSPVTERMNELFYINRYYMSWAT